MNNRTFAVAYGVLVIFAGVSILAHRNADPYIAAMVLLMALGHTKESGEASHGG